MRLDYVPNIWGLGLWICAPNKLHGWNLCLTLGPLWFQLGKSRAVALP